MAEYCAVALTCLLDGGLSAGSGTGQSLLQTQLKALSKVPALQADPGGARLGADEA